MHILSYKLKGQQHKIFELYYFKTDWYSEVNSKLKGQSPKMLEL
jgi:hypothetical protein